jgi:hypothetical protein
MDVEELNEGEEFRFTEDRNRVFQLLKHNPGGKSVIKLVATREGDQWVANKDNTTQECEPLEGCQRVRLDYVAY